MKTISDYEWDVQFESHGMKLIRFGELGRKRPGVLLEQISPVRSKWCGGYSEKR